MQHQEKLYERAQARWEATLGKGKGNAQSSKGGQKGKEGGGQSNQQKDYSENEVLDVWRLALSQVVEERAMPE